MFQLSTLIQNQQNHDLSSCNDISNMGVFELILHTSDSCSMYMYASIVPSCMKIYSTWVESIRDGRQNPPAEFHVSEVNAHWTFYKIRVCLRSMRNITACEPDDSSTEIAASVDIFPITSQSTFSLAEVLRAFKVTFSIICPLYQKFFLDFTLSDFYVQQAYITFLFT